MSAFADEIPEQPEVGFANRLLAGPREWPSWARIAYFCTYPVAMPLSYLVTLLALMWAVAIIWLKGY